MVKFCPDFVTYGGNLTRRSTGRSFGRSSKAVGSQATKTTRTFTIEKKTAFMTRKHSCLHSCLQEQDSLPWPVMLSLWVHHCSPILEPAKVCCRRKKKTYSIPGFHCIALIEAGAENHFFLGMHLLEDL